MRAISGRDASCRATSLPIPALAPVINTDFAGVVLIVIASLLVEVQPGLAERCGAVRRRGGSGGRALLVLAWPGAAPSPFRDARWPEIATGLEYVIHFTAHHMACRIQCPRYALLMAAGSSDRRRL